MNDNPLDPQRPDTEPQGVDETHPFPRPDVAPAAERVESAEPLEAAEPTAQYPTAGWDPMDHEPTAQIPAAGQPPVVPLPPVVPFAEEHPTSQYPTPQNPTPQNPTAQYPTEHHPTEQHRTEQQGQQAAAASGGPGQHLGSPHAPTYGAEAAHSAQRPPWDSAPPAAATPRRRGRAGIAAAAVGILLAGGVAGAAGAKLWTASNDSSAQTPTSTSSVVDNGKQVVANGTVASVAAKVLPSVVKIEVTGSNGSGSGSGIILSSDGEILTNHHVVELAQSGGTLTVIFNDGTRAPAKIVGTDALTDSALIKAEGKSDLTPADLGKSANLVVGQDVVAIGAPFGLNATVTSGIVSALERPVNVGQDDSGNSTTYPAIQTDAAINPGNSGGPLVDMNGNVIGINSSIRTASDSSSSESGSIGLGFAIPIDELLPIVEQMRAGETPTHARLGISVASAASGDTIGAPVNSVGEGSTAGKAGLKKGDIITKVDDHLIDGADSLIATVRSYRPGDKVTVTWERNGKSQTATLKLDSDEGTLASGQSESQGQSQGQGQGQSQGQGESQQESPFGGGNSNPFNPFGN